MSVMLFKSYTARIEFDADDHIFVGRLAGITDIVTFHGVTVKELESAFKEAVNHYLAVSEETGIPPQKPYSGKLMLRMPPEVHAHAAMMAEAHGKSINQWAAEVLASAR